MLAMGAISTMALDRQDAAVGSPQQRFETLLNTHRGIVFKVASIYCRDVEEQRDLAQEIRAQAWRAYPRYDASRSFSTWMYRIALNVAISFRRSVEYRRRHVSPIDSQALESIPDPRHDADDRLRELYTVIDQLDDMNRALVLLYLEGRNYQEIADVLGISETNVSTKLSRLKQRLRDQVASVRPGAVSLETNDGTR
jgi:RNA polymerase sigma factor (sigma-70 family)